MKRLSARLALFSLLASLPVLARSQSYAPASSSLAGMARLFETPPDDSRIMMRWWWFGPSVTKAELEKEMRLMKEGGIGGFEVQPVYPLALDDAKSGIKNLPFLSDEFIDSVRFTSEKAKELGLRMDLTLGSGWPFGGATVPIADAAARLRVERVKVAEGAKRVTVPPLGDTEKLVAVFFARLQGQAAIDGSVHEVTDLRDGAVFLTANEQAPGEVQFFIASRTGMMVKRAGVGAEGFVLNHYDRGATLGYLKSVGDRLMQAFGPNPPHAIFCDSLEAYGNDWTEDLLAEFQKRRGYDLRPHLPALVIDAGPKTAAIRRDWGKTLTELLDERFMAPVKEWSTKNRTLFRIQGYGIPPATISSNALADLSEGEGHLWKTVRASRWASSASHLFGQPVTSSETWTWLHSPVFAATPLDLKAEADLHFLQGVNQLIGHGWPYTAEGVEYPGWRFYASGVYNEKNPWWIAMPDLARYLQRMSFVLRQGQPKNDVALYLPNEDAWAQFTTGGNVHLIQILNDRMGPDVMAKILESGFNLDFVDDDAIAKLGKVDKGGLALGTNRYRTVVLPGVERVPLAIYRKLEEFARAGGSVIATRTVPSTAPGFLATEAEHAEVRAVSDRLFKGPAAAGVFVEDEKTGLGPALTKAVNPDLALSPSVPDMGFVHRSAGGAEIYFIANTSNVRQDVKATFRVERSSAESWDAMTGRVSPLNAQANPAGGMTLSLSIPAYGSQVVVFSKRTLPRALTFPKRALAPALDLSSGWRVTFGPNAKPVELDKLTTWTDDEATRYFSGVAAYEKTVVATESLLRPDTTLTLDFGEGRAIRNPDPRARMRAWVESPIREVAVVYINGRRAGAVWAPPYKLDVTGLLKRGENQVRIDVANLAVNHMAGHALPDYKLLNLRYGVRFEAQDMDKIQVTPSGLLGGVRLVATQKGAR